MKGGRWRWASGLLVVVVVTVAVGAFAVWRAVRPPSVTAFYEAPSVVGDKPGLLLRSEVIDSKVTGVRLWRILYTSTNADGTVVPVSGLVAAPTGPAPPGGYPLVGVAHGTIGINQGCAPSLAPWARADADNTTYSFLVGQYVSAGYATVMSDFQGLGVRGDNSYLVGDIEAHDVLDSVRAVRSFGGLAVSRDTLIAGQSQGGHAALFAGQLAPSYAPDVHVIGVVAQAPATDLEAMFQGVLDSGRRGGVVSLPVMAADAYARTYPAVKIDQVLTKRGRGALRDVIGRVCLSPAVIATQLARPSDLVAPGGFDVLRPYAERNTPSARLTMPVFVAQGTADQVVSPTITAGYVKELCSDGVEVTSRTYAEVGHFDVVTASTSDALAWMGAVRAGHPPTSTCAR